jgi:hypothetical protein
MYLQGCESMARPFYCLIIDYYPHFAWASERGSHQETNLLKAKKLGSVLSATAQAADWPR